MTVAWCVGAGGVAGAKTFYKGVTRITRYSHVTMTQAVFLMCYVVQYTVCPQGGRS